MIFSYVYRLLIKYIHTVIFLTWTKCQIFSESIQTSNTVTEDTHAHSQTWLFCKIFIYFLLQNWVWISAYNVACKLIGSGRHIWFDVRWLQKHLFHMLIILCTCCDCFRRTLDSKCKRSSSQSCLTRWVQFGE
jgi:hypothetical protein